MSITINGATNTLTAASGLNIAGNTAITGALSATGGAAVMTLNASPSNLAAYYKVANDGGNYYIGAESSAGGSIIVGSTAYALAINSESNRPVQIGVANNLIGSFSNTGLAVTGTLSASGLLTANGGSPGNPSLATQYQMSVGTDIVLNPSGYGVVVSGSRVVAIDTTGLAVTGRLDLSAASSGQIKFPATQNASADANTLDDYEEGTWTPAIGVNGFSGAPTPSGVSGTYTKVGRLVTVSLSLTFGAGTYPATYCTLTGLPFAPATDYSVGSYGNGSAGSGAVGGTCQATTASQVVLFQSTPTTTGTVWFATVTYHV